MTATPPQERRCARCKQTRPVFPYKPEHDCLKVIGLVNLIEAAEHIAWLEDIDDRWCTAKVERRQILLCVPCHDREHAEERKLIDTVLDSDAEL